MNLILALLCVSAFAQNPPGAVDPHVTQKNIQETICRHGYTDTVRPSVWYTNKIKVQQMKSRHLRGLPKDYELDHFIPLELGGDPRDPANLLMQPWPEARRKDQVEDFLHAAVCTGRMKLKEAQSAIYRWPEIYAQFPKR